MTSPYIDKNCTLYLGDCLHILPHIPDNSIATWITSPPYAKQRSYSGAASKDYIEFFSPIFLEALRTLKTSGSIFINIKEHCEKGSRDLYVYKLIIHLTETLGATFVDEFIWHKTNPFPTGAKLRLKDGYERVLHFTKSRHYKFYPTNVLIPSKAKSHAAEKRRTNKESYSTTNNSGMNMSRRICPDLVRPSNVLTGSSSNINIGHSAVYPEYLPEFFIKLTTEEGDIVGDMFMGSGTTGVVCRKLKRQFIGVELEPEYFALAKKRVAPRLIIPNSLDISP